MKNMLKKQNGISLITLSITIIILVIVTDMLIYNAKDNTSIKALKNMYNDVEVLRDKVSDYYNQYGDIPVIKDENKNLEHQPDQEILDLCGNIDKDGNGVLGKFYVIDLSSIDGLTLNYGEDYKKIKDVKDTIDQQTLNSYKDLYIINEISHNIFFAEGIEVDGKNYYTDIEQKDDTIINLKYIDGIKIPEKCTYISGDKNSGIKIKDDAGTTYTWKVVQDKITSIDRLPKTDCDQYELLTSINNFHGYYLSEDESKIIYLPIDSGNWTPISQQSYVYTDQNGDSAKIPAGFKVSMTDGMNAVVSGLVIEDESQNQYVWIEVPKSLTVDAVTDEEIEAALKNYTSDYKNDGYKDIWYDSSGKTENDEGYNASDTNGCGMTLIEYKEIYSKMLNSIKDNGGFWVGRYEAGTETERNAAGETTQQMLIKQNLYPYNWITCSQAQKLCAANSTENYTSSLMFGIQWDLTLKFIENSGMKTNNDIKKDSTGWGNYINSNFNISRGSYSLDNGGKYTKVQTYEKQKDISVLLTTGASERNCVLNIYDLAGNIHEWTLERNGNREDIISTSRAGYCIDNGGIYPAYQRGGTNQKSSVYYIGIRPSIY